MIPEGWRELQLKDVIKLASGDGRPSDVVANPDELRTNPVYGGNGILGYSGEANSHAGDIIIGRVGEYCGITRFVSGAKWITDNALYVKEIEAGFDRRFLALKLQHYDLSRLRAKGGQPLVSQKPIYGLRFGFPPEDEQVAIRVAVKTWDRAIETVEALIAGARAQKQALMQQLLPQGTTPPKKRLPGFSGEWRTLRIGDVAKEISERAGEEAGYPVLSCSKYDGMVESLTYFKKKVYSDDTSNYKVMRRGTFGFPSNHIEEGSIGYQDLFNAGIVSPIYCVFATDEQVDDGFLYKLLKTDRYRQIFAAATNASVDRRGSLRWKEFSRIPLPLPPLEEQRAINEAVNAVADVERGYETQLTALRQEKAALMQQLLTGKRRVKLVREEEAC